MLLINKVIPYSRYVINFNAAALLSPQREVLLSIIDEKPLGKSSRIPSNEFEKNSWMYYLEKIVNEEAFDSKRLYLTVLLNELCKNINKTEESAIATKEEKLIVYKP